MYRNASFVRNRKRRVNGRRLRWVDSKACRLHIFLISRFCPTPNRTEAKRIRYYHPRQQKDNFTRPSTRSAYSSLFTYSADRPTTSRNKSASGPWQPQRWGYNQRPSSDPRLNQQPESSDCFSWNRYDRCYRKRNSQRCSIPVSSSWQRRPQCLGALHTESSWKCRCLKTVFLQSTSLRECCENLETASRSVLKMKRSKR